jgi:hypothetical protein
MGGIYFSIRLHLSQQHDRVTSDKTSITELSQLCPHSLPICDKCMCVCVCVCVCVRAGVFVCRPLSLSLSLSIYIYIHMRACVITYTRLSYLADERY